MPASLLDLLFHVHETTRQFGLQMPADKPETVSAYAPPADFLKYVSGPVQDSIPFKNLPPQSLDDREPFYVSCRCAASIHLKSLGRMTSFSSNGNQNLAQRLRKSLSQYNTVAWHEREPELYIWVCFTGAAAAQEGASWFLAKAEPVVMSLEPDELHTLKLGTTQFCRLLRYLEAIEV